MTRRRLFNFTAALSLLLLLPLLCMTTFGIGRFTISKIAGASTPVKYTFGFDGHAFVIYVEDVPSEARIASALAQLNARFSGAIHRSDVSIGGEASTKSDRGLTYVENGNVRLIFEVAAAFYAPVGPPLGSFKLFAFSIWIPIVPLTILPAFAACRLLPRLGHDRPGLCQRCSYNLEGNESGICPECGTPIPKRVETVA